MAFLLFPFSLTQHARERALQRGIDLEWVRIVLRFGRRIRYRQGPRYSLAGVTRPPFLSPEQWEAARCLLVPVDENGRIPTLIRMHPAD